MNCDGTQTWNGSKKGMCRETTTPAGAFVANPWGLFDLHGNVWEWCADWFDERYYGRTPAVNPVCEGRALTRRVLRGGSFHTGPRNCRAASRYRFGPGDFGEFSGFRVAFCLN